MNDAGFSLVEVIVSTLVVSLLFVASLSAVSASQASRQVLADQAIGYQLAQDLMSEILRDGYYDPSGADGMGPHPSEVTGNRSQFNDVDDYLGWTASPPQYRDGSTMPGLNGWTRAVDVAYINPTGSLSAGTSSHRAKLITVTVRRGERQVARLRAIRTAAMSDLDNQGRLP